MNSLVAIQSYPFFLIYKREGKNLSENLDDALRRAKAGGIEGWEHTLFNTREEAETFGSLLKKHSLWSQSIYENVRLHESDWEARVDAVLRRVAYVKPLGIRVLVVNPEPIEWNKPLNKSDAQLRLQAKALQALGERLAAAGAQLAYHIHAPEMRASAREFHHMMLHCGREVGLCLDAHWIYRGAENSEAALYDIIELYGERIVSLHLRQSRNGIWSETLGDGDIDYRPLAARLKKSDFRGPIVIEQCFETGTPRTMPVDEAHRAGREWVRRVFGA